MIAGNGSTSSEYGVRFTSMRYGLPAVFRDCGKEHGGVLALICKHRGKPQTYRSGEIAVSVGTGECAAEQRFGPSELTRGR